MEINFHWIACKHSRRLNQNDSEVQTTDCRYLFRENCSAESNSMHIAHKSCSPYSTHSLYLSFSPAPAITPNFRNFFFSIPVLGTKQKKKKLKCCVHFTIRIWRREWKFASNKYGIVRLLCFSVLFVFFVSPSMLYRAMLCHAVPCHDQYTR